MLSLAALLEDSARTFPDRDALVLGSARLSYREVDEAANQVANLLVSRGIKPGDKVALSCPNVAQFPIIYFGALKAGAVIVPLNILLKGREIAYHLEDAEVVAYFCFEGTSELAMASEGHTGFRQTACTKQFFVITLDPAASSPIPGTETLGQALAPMSCAFDSIAREPGDTAIILYTSGTTGHPKGAELSHANTMMNVVANNRLFSSQPATDSHLVALPLFHTFGATVQMLAGISMAATLHLIPRFDALDVIEVMDREQITFFAGVPTMWWGLLKALTDDIDVDRIARNLRIGISGGAAMPIEITQQVKERFGVTVLEGYGLSETSPVATFNRLDIDPRPGSIGLPIWGVELKLINPCWDEITEPGEVGEIAIRGHNVMKRYHNRPEATAEVIRDGWFRTGDLARRDNDGFYYIVDRSKDLIIRGGFNVYPREIEELLLTHPAVSLAAVIGVPHDSHGEEIKAFVIREAGATVSADELIAWTRKRIAAYKYPRTIEFVTSLPMTASGKILKRQLA